MAAGTTVDMVKGYMGLSPADDLDDEALQQATDAANDMVAALRTDLADLTDWPARVTNAATMWAARLYRRRGSIEGLAGYSDMGGAVPISRLDPDIAAELELGTWQRSVVA
jgi:hypothetical protein